MRIFTFLYKKLLFTLIIFLCFQGFSQNQLINGDFESGGAGVGFTTNYFLPAAVGNSAPRNYNIITDPFTMNTANFAHCGDYPSGTGKMMVVDGSGSVNDKVWELLNGSSIGVISGHTYEFTYYIRSISGTNDVNNSAIINVETNGTTSIPMLMSGPSICPVGNPSVWTKVVYRWTATTSNAQIWLDDAQFFGGGAGNDFALDNISLIDVLNICLPPTVSVTQQPTCAVPTGTIVFTSPLNTSPFPPPTDLFISEVTDESTGALSYIEIYNGTGVTKNLTNYKIKVYNNGNPGPSLNCDFPLLGNLANNDVFVISVGSATNQGGVLPDMVVNLCPGFNTNDNVRLTTIGDVEIDLWGRTDGIDFTPSNLDGYTYRRLSSVLHPSLTWNPADWTALDPQDYTNVGTYQMNIYEYSINGVNYQSSPTFTGLAPNTVYNVTIRDLITGCISTPIPLTVNAITPSPPPSVNPITYCQNATAVPLTAIPATGGTLNWYGTNAVGGVASATAPTPVTTGALGSVIHYYVSQTIGGCESTRADIAVTIGNNPPTATPFLFCDGAATTATTVGFDFNNAGQTSFTYTYTVGNGAPVTGTFTAPSHFDVPVTSQGQAVTLTITWNGICTPSITKTCYSSCTVTPVNSIHNPAAVCSPNTVDITAPAVTAGTTGGGSITYWTDAAATIPLANPTTIAVSGTYYIKSSLGNCTDIDPVVVTINPTPSLTITNPAAVCSPGTVNITLPAVTAGSTAGTLTYWTNATATTTLATPTAVAASGTYYIKNTVGTCFDIEPVTVTISPTPVLTITNPAAVCSPGTVNITLPAVTAGSTGGGVLTYWTNATATTALATATAVTTSGTYYIKSTLGSCSDIKPVVVTITTTPVLTITNPAAVCSPGTVNITLPSITAGSTGGGTLSYWFDAATTIGLANPTTVASSGTYYIKTTVGTCFDIEPVVVTISPTPSLVITNPAAVCSPGTVNITLPAVTAGSTGGGTLSYWTNATATTALATPTAVATSGTYYIKSTLGSCSDIEPVVVTISPTPVLTITNPAAVCSPNTVNITLTAVTAGSTGGGALSYWFDAATTIGLANPTAVAASGTYYIKTTVGTCFDIEPVVVTISPTPSLAITNPAAVCSPGTVNITLPAVTTGSTGGGTLTYWTNATATAAFANPTAVAVSGTYYIKSTLGACSDIESVTVTINPTPSLIITNPAAVCSPNTVNITLPAVMAGSTGGGTLSYWTNATATTVLANPTAVAASGTYYIKSTVGTCFDIDPVVVTISPTPVLSIHNPAAVCAPNTVDITLPAVTAGSTVGGTLSYWTNATATTALANPTAVTTSGIYYIKSTLGLCFDIEPVTVTVSNPNLVITNPAAVCSPNTVNITLPAVTAGSTGGGTLSYWTNATATTALANPTAVAISGTYYIKSTVGTCFDIESVTVTINGNFAINTPLPLQMCDPNNDGFETFDLTQTINSITGGNPAYTVTFHETQVDANVGGTTIPVPSSYTNINPSLQTIYIRVTSSSSSCFQTTTLQLIINPTPVATTPLPYQLCDTTSPTGYEVFNLNTRIPEILGSMNPALTSVTFYTTLADAQAHTNVINNPGNYTNAIINTQIIYVRVETIATGCYDIVGLQLIVNPLPNSTQPNYPQYSLCDNDQTNIGFETFDLGSKIDDILLGQTGMAVTFYISLGDAQNGTGQITNLLYTNQIQYVQTLGIRITNSATGCYVISTIDIRVEPLPVLTPPTLPYTLCDENQDGYTTFDLTTLLTGLLNGITTYTVSFHETEDDALINGNTIPNPASYDNILAYMQIIYVRAEDNITHCVSITPIELDVNPSPIAPAFLDTIVVCDQDNSPQSATTLVDLTQQTAAVLAQQPLAPSSYTVTYYNSQAAAEAGTAPIIPDTSYFGTNGETIWVRVENNITGCFSVGSFLLEINTPLLLTTPTPLSICDDDTPNENDQFHVFDLTIKDFEIAQGLGTVTYYPSLLDAQNNTSVITTPSAYTNIISAVQTLGVVVTTPAGCKSITTLDIRVLPIPTPNTNPPALAPKCDDNNPGDMVEVFDLTVNQGYIANGDLTLTFHYYPTQTDAENNTNEITTPTAASVGHNVWIHVENTMVDFQGNHCYVLVEQALTVNPLPTVVQPLPPYRVCDDNADGIAQFDLTNPLLAPQILGLTQLPADYTISYYLSAANAASGTAPLATPYTNVTPTSQNIYIRVVNNATGCVNATGVLTLAVEAYATATGPQVFTECDNYGSPYDGVDQVDLTQYQTAILNGQDPAIFLVSYYTSLADATAGTNALSLAQASTYVMDSADTDTVWVKVENSSNSITPFCYALTTIDMIIERYPNPIINTPNGVNTICVDYVTNNVIRDLTLNSGITNTANYSFEWYEASDPTTIISTDPTYTVTTPQAGGGTRSYTVHVTSNSTLACDTTSASFDVLQSGPAVIPAGTDGYTVTNAFSDTQIITVIIEGYGTYEYSLDDGPRQTSNIFEGVSLGAHIIHVWDSEGGIAYSCEQLIISNVQIIDYPHYFTPNGDGIHDTWNIVGLSGQPGARIYIFDRYGKLLKQISSNGPGWDGTYTGHLMPSDDYWFSVEFVENATVKDFKAHFALKR